MLRRIFVVSSSSSGLGCGCDRLILACKPYVSVQSRREKVETVDHSRSSPFQHLSCPQITQPFVARKQRVPLDENGVKTIEKATKPSTENFRSFPSATRNFLHWKGYPEITEPIAFTQKKKKKKQQAEEARIEFEKLYGVDKEEAKLIVDCSRSEYNHYQGMKYPTEEPPLVTQYWTKCKYKNEWFQLRTSAPNPSFNRKAYNNWDELSRFLEPRIMDNIKAAGFKRPSLIQARFISAFDSSSEHLFLAAETGSGKTTAYGAPLLTTLLKRKQHDGYHRAIVLVPAVDLLNQTVSVFRSLAKNTGLIVSTADEDTKAWDVLIVTPRTIVSILRELDSHELSSIAYLVLDEADTLLDDSFLSELKHVVNLLPVMASETDPSTVRGTVRVIFSSATCPDELCQLAEAAVFDQPIKFITTDNLHRLQPHVTQKFIRLRQADKLDQLQNLLETSFKGSKTAQTLVFCKDKKTAHYVSKSLMNRGIENQLVGHRLNPKLSMENCRMGEFLVLIATDGMARGLDLPLLRHTINFDFPHHMVDYVHRIGRVGRCGSKGSGLVTSFVHRSWEVKLVNEIEMAARFDRPLHTIETNVAGMLKDRGGEKKKEDDDDEDDR